MTDFRLDDHGSLCVLTPVSDEAIAWTAEHVGDSETLTRGGGVVIEPRYVQPILDGIEEAGMVVQA